VSRIAVVVAARNPARDAAELTVPPRAGKRLVFTNGCFDLLHRGHVSYLQAARALGDDEGVALNSDASVRKLKGPGRPIGPQKDRAAVLRALRSVDAVVVFDEDTPVHLMRDLKPNVYVKGGDHRVEDLPEAEVAGKIGAEVRIIPFEEGYSTAALIEKIKGLLDQGNLPG
jgi:rfaE bifunctional protein nucleotidyltransferase chain/domain